MDSMTGTDAVFSQLQGIQENILLEIIKDLCTTPDNKLGSSLKTKVMRIVADCDLSHYSGLHKLTSDESTSSLLGFMSKTTTELSYDEQTELNNAIINKIQNQVPILMQQLDTLGQNSTNNHNEHKGKLKELQESLDDKLKTLEEQESEKMDLMVQWLNHRLSVVMTHWDNSSEIYYLKTKILELKSKILHLQILQNIFTETNQSIKAYKEVHKDLMESIRESENRIKQFKETIGGEYL